MWLVPIALIGIVAYFIFQRHDTRGMDSPGETPMDILKKRYAKGEITKEKFERMQRELQ